MTTPFNQFYRQPYLKQQWQFPNSEAKDLASQVDKAYIDIAIKVNSRIIGIFPNNAPVVTGESWYISGGNQRQQTLRQIYNFGAIAPGTELDIPTGITNLIEFTRIYGTVVTTINDYRPLPYVDPGTPTTGMALLVGTIAGIQQIRIVLGVTAAPVSSGVVVLEWLSQF